MKLKIHIVTIASAVSLFAFLTVVANTGTAGEPVRLPSQYPEPGLSFGTCERLSLPKTLLYSAGPEEVIADAEQWKRRGIDGFFLQGCVGGWQNNIWATDGDPATVGEADATFLKAKQANTVCKRIGSEAFLLVTFGHFFNWFDNPAWPGIVDNFRQFAIFAREAGCKGVAFDIEYVSDQYFFEWEGYKYDGYTREDLVKTMRKRMTDVIRVMYDEFPGMVLLTLPDVEFWLGTHIHVAWIEEAARRDAPGGIHYCTGYTYRNHNIRYMFGRAWLDNSLMHRLLSERGQEYWRKRCSIGPGVWPFGMPEYLGHGPELTPEEFRHGLAGSLMMTSHYNWIFTGGCKPQLLERGLDKYTRKEDVREYLRVMAAKEVVTTEKYVALAEDIRRMKLRDYSEDLGVALEVWLTGPHDYGKLDLSVPGSFDARLQPALWQAALDRFHGRDVDLREKFGTATHWMIIGPFPGEGTELAGHHTIYPPEREIDLGGEYDGVSGKIRWVEYRRDDGFTSVDFTKVFKPTEQVCAYALCYVTSPKEIQAQIRLATNDSGKLWLDGKLLFDFPHESGVILDKEIVSVTLPEGTVPVLLKVCNGELNWGFVFRITDEDGLPLRQLQYSATPP